MDVWVGVLREPGGRLPDRIAHLLHDLQRHGLGLGLVKVLVFVLVLGFGFGFRVRVLGLGFMVRVLGLGLGFEYHPSIKPLWM